MDSSIEGAQFGQNQGPIPPIPHHPHHHHHHHWFYISPHCPFHRPILEPSNHSPSCSFFTSQNTVPAPAYPNSTFSDHPQVYNVLDKELDEITEVELEDDEDTVLVLTDEWRDFFAKSEAKRRLAKKQAKNKGKK